MSSPARRVKTGTDQSELRAPPPFRRVRRAPSDVARSGLGCAQDTSTAEVPTLEIRVLQSALSENRSQHLSGIHAPRLWNVRCCSSAGIGYSLPTRTRGRPVSFKVSCGRRRLGEIGALLRTQPAEEPAP